MMKHSSRIAQLLPRPNNIHQTRLLSILKFRSNRTVTPRNSYITNKTYPQLIWNNYIPSNLKIFSVIGTGIIGFIKLNPNVWITLGPPIAIGTFYMNKYIKHRIYLNNVSTVLPEVHTIDDKDQNVIIEENLKAETALPSLFKPTEIVKILPYDESQIYNLKYEIDNQYDSLRKQIIDLIEKRIKESILLSQNSTDQVCSIMNEFMEDDQFNININENEIESWITSKVKLPSSKDESNLKQFIKLSFPYYSSKTVKDRKRIGTLAIYLIKINETDWKIDIEINKLGWFNSESVWIKELDNSENMESDLYKTYRNS
ncbi:hypothetical protein KGF54_001649 [Candida jiufengensis]|uniref:uncharacterized protein n=1 Tax=Candida jiufengensis TaxID=497108 RepID=UPI002224875D|nr:uncharacterized protein KGF54_001649 [Candida jiufengensis]KAI5955088.1 hypothetical protein KGF54_001649 [Candida jiufengensis]